MFSGTKTFLLTSIGMYLGIEPEWARSLGLSLGSVDGCKLILLYIHILGSIYVIYYRAQFEFPGMPAIVLHTYESTSKLAVRACAATQSPKPDENTQQHTNLYLTDLL